MYEFYYGYLKRKYSAKLLFTDTYSLVCDIGAENIHEDFYEDKKFYDFSDYSRDSRFSVFWSSVPQYIYFS